jgi:stage II sporulation protein D
MVTVLGLVAALVAGAGATAHAAEVYPRPLDGKWTVTGHGNGHGHGMSQYGALGAARAGRSWQEIIGFYYRGTTPGPIPSTAIRVRVATLGSVVEAYPADGLSVKWNVTQTASSVLPATKNGVTVARWRIVPSAKVAGTPTRFRLEYLPAGSATWAYYATASVPLTGAFLNPKSGTVTTRRGSDLLVYRGELRGALIGSAGAETLVPVVALPLESYLRTVVPGEVFASWPQETLRAQAVAARSFAAYHRRFAPISPTFYDVYDDTRSQVFKPTWVNGVSNEVTSTNTAISGTANMAALYQGEPAFTQFSASSGGWSSAGSKPYLVAQRDDWDAVADNPYHTWTATVAVSSLEARFPSIGTFQKLTITSRNGLGDFGGRVLTATVTGSAGSVATTGEQLRSTLGLGRSDWFKPTFVSFPSYPRDVTGDRLADVLAIESGTGALRVYPTTGAGGWKPVIRQEPGVWDTYAKVLTAGTWNEDSISDVLYQTSSGDLFLRRGNGNGTFAPGVKVGSGWQVHNKVIPVGDFGGDKLTDLIARRASDGALFLYSGNGYGGFKPTRQIGSGWNAFSEVLSPGDFTGDALPDLLAVATEGTLYLYPGNGTGGFKPRTVIGGGWNAFTAVTAVGDFTGDGRNDVLARRADGSLRVYPGNGAGGFLVSKAVGSGWNIFSAILK